LPVDALRLELLKGVVVGYRRGPKTQRPKECLLMFPGVNSPSEASQLIGKKVAWPVGERKCVGKILSTHGKNGLLRARFRKGLPGEALGTQVEIIG